jgi:hypothetical protein
MIAFFRVVMVLIIQEPSATLFQPLQVIPLELQNDC